MTARAPERAFPTSDRGDARADVLRNFRVGLRELPNPETGQPFTEREIQIATSDLTRWYAEADALDLVLWDGQRRAIFLADQARPARATASFLFSYHADLWGEAPRPGSGGSGTATATATTGAIFPGSTTVPDGGAAQATDPAGNTYQVLFDVTASGGSAVLTMQAVDTGEATNIPAGTELVWSANKPLSAAEKFTASTDFRGGAAQETAAEFAERLLERIRRKPAAGNPAHFRSWALDASTSIAEAFVYPCAFWAGSVLVCVLQRRGDTEGPDGRIATAATLSAAIAYLTPPTSPVVPVPPLVVVVTAQKNSIDGAIAASMPKGRDAGWADVEPWPSIGTSAPVYSAISSVTSQTEFELTRGSGSDDLPSGTTPRLMVLDEDRTRFEELDVLSVTATGGDTFDVELSSAPSTTLAVGQYVSPWTELAPTIGATIEAYFDDLGPGEVVDLTDDDRAHRAFRHPRTSEQSPARAGSGVLVFLEDVLGAVIADATLDYISSNNPPVPADPADGPSLNVARHWGVYPPTT